MVRFLKSQGFTLVRIRGSHHYMARDELRTSVPVHGRKVLKIGTLRGILRDVRISPQEFRELWPPKREGKGLAPETGASALGDTPP
jgi:predicted RNA binding protein YcfA (HicA-like mRNA interferase family)